MRIRSYSTRRTILAAALLVFVFAALFLGGFLRAQQTTKLCLTDGTFQVVSNYEIRGDRVRFYSVERSEWEEVPFSLVDLDATRRAKAQDATDAQKAIGKARELDREHFDRPPDSGPQIAPGIHLPPEEGIYS